MFAGRTLAEQVLPVLDDPAAVDRATRSWEADRDRECLPAYHFANSDTRNGRPSPALCEVVREAGRTASPDLSDFFGRGRTPQQITPPARLVRALFAALWRGERPRSETVISAVADLRTEVAIRRELAAERFRSTRLISGSDHPGASWPEPPSVSGRHIATPPPQAATSSEPAAIVGPAAAVGAVAGEVSA
jgi:hypothetical protein